MRRHPPDLSLYTQESMVQAINERHVVCRRCGHDALELVHWAPVGVREHLLHFFGLLR